jgi:rhodanese-related sulfurtransferase
MKKIFLLVIVLFLAACETPQYRMDNLDDYIMSPTIQKVDVRSQAERIANGYVDYFQTIPLFEFLDGNAVDLSQGYDRFRPSDIKDEALIRRLFDENAEAIVVMCNSGARSGYVVAVLEHLGYENVYNLGGYRSYQGAYFIRGQQQ